MSKVRDIINRFEERTVRALPKHECRVGDHIVNYRTQEIGVFTDHGTESISRWFFVNIDTGAIIGSRVCHDGLGLDISRFLSGVSEWELYSG